VIVVSCPPCCEPVPVKGRIHSFSSDVPTLLTDQSGNPGSTHA
jgi:hypothetical protein